MDESGSPDAETYNPWSVVNLVFHHLADQGLHPVLGATGDPGPPAADVWLLSPSSSCRSLRIARRYRMLAACGERPSDAAASLLAKCSKCRMSTIS